MPRSPDLAIFVSATTKTKPNAILLAHALCVIKTSLLPESCNAIEGGREKERERGREGGGREGGGRERERKRERESLKCPEYAITCPGI